MVRTVSEPRRPEGVAVYLAGRGWVLCEVTGPEIGEDGIAEWRILLPVGVGPADVQSVHVDVFPARTSILLPLAGSAGDR